MEPIPVDAARRIADDFRKDIILIVAWDAESNKSHIVTWGREPQHKECAAAGGDTIQKALKLEDGTQETYEDFRREGESAGIVNALRRKLAAIGAALNEIVISEGQDAGVILLSDESPTHFDTDQKCQIYDYENFSPLGNALVALSKLVQG